METVERSERCARRQPLRSSRNLSAAADRLAIASSRLVRVARHLAEANACIARHPEDAADLMALQLHETERWMYLTLWLENAANEVFTLHRSVLDGVATGELVPEREGPRRPRIVLAPRPVPVRAFLLVRMPRVAERVSPILRRRRRTRRAIALSVPGRASQGRAPPVASV